MSWQGKLYFSILVTSKNLAYFYAEAALKTYNENNMLSIIILAFSRTYLKILVLFNLVVYKFTASKQILLLP